MIVNMIGRRQTDAIKVLFLLLLACAACFSPSSAHRRRRREPQQTSSSHQDSPSHHHRSPSNYSQGEQIKSTIEEEPLGKWRSNPLIEWRASISGDLREQLPDLDAKVKTSPPRASSSSWAEKEFCLEAEEECSSSSFGEKTTNENENKNENANANANEEDSEQLHPPIDEHQAGGSICASDGRLYGSLCQLKRRSCRSKRALSVRPRSFCQDTSGSANEEQCDSASYGRFKWLLWAQYDESVAKMFRSLDRNSDQLIEAHELWPQNSLADRNEQSWLRHRSHCQEEERDEKDCWFHLDFPFEPRFSGNPCSLSHLMLFELRPPRNRFTLDSLRLAFIEQQLNKGRQQLSSDDTRLASFEPEEAKQFQRVKLELGQSALLACPRLADTGEDIGKVECTWSRYNVSLADHVKEPHLSFLEAGGNPRRAYTTPQLRIADAQLHLSGPFRCACQSATNKSAEHLYYVQVSGAPRVEVRPKFEWALPNSRATFQCHHDHIDTSGANLSATKVRWLRRHDSGEEEEISTGSNPTAAGHLNLEHLQANQSGHYVCQVEVASSPSEFKSKFKSKLEELVTRDEAQLVVQEAPVASLTGTGQQQERTWLWMFHDEGVSIYRLQPEEQEMVLASEISGHQQVSAEVDGNWNQLTLCGGLNTEQVVICEWSDNAIHVVAQNHNRSYIYVGQPNLNRVIVFDSLGFELVAIINTEPQPRKLYPYQPNKIHLSKWARRHLPWRHGATKRSANNGDSAKLHDIQQHDIWLLCYGQPLVVDPTGDEHLNEEEAGAKEEQNDAGALSGPHSRAITNNEELQTKPSELLSDAEQRLQERRRRRRRRRRQKAFTPRLSTGWWPTDDIGLNMVANERSRKSVHIIQSTFLPANLMANDNNYNETLSLAAQFKASTWLNTLHVSAGGHLNIGNLIQDLHVPARPYAMQSASLAKRHKLREAYVSHQNERRLFGLSMEEFRYERDIDLHDCDPIHLLASAQGSLILQCRSNWGHERQLQGQLLLDQLTGARLAFDGQVRAQVAYLSPDNRYLISVYTAPNPNSNAQLKAKQRETIGWAERQRQSIIYVQSVRVGSLKLEYEIKTSSLEISQCAFVWKDGYYAAIFVSLNKRDQQSEILSLRLADGRLELMARVPGLVGFGGDGSSKAPVPLAPHNGNQKEQLVVSPELRLAALSTNQGTYVVDLEDNRVSQSLRRHQSLPTLLWASTPS